MNGDGGDERQVLQRADSERRIDDRLRDIERRLEREETYGEMYRAKVDAHEKQIEGSSRLNGWLVGLSAFGGAIMTVVAGALGGHLPK